MINKKFSLMAAVLILAAGIAALASSAQGYYGSYEKKHVKLDVEVTKVYGTPRKGSRGPDRSSFTMIDISTRDGYLLKKGSSITCEDEKYILQAQDASAKNFFTKARQINIKSWTSELVLDLSVCKNENARCSRFSKKLHYGPESKDLKPSYERGKLAFKEIE